MALPSHPNQISLKDILEEKQGSTTARINVSLKGLSLNGYNDYDSVDLTGTPNGTEPYGVGEFHGWSAIFADFTVRGNETGNPSTGLFSHASSDVQGQQEQADAEAMARFYVYYNLDGNVAIWSQVVAQADNLIDCDDRYYTQAGTEISLGTGSNDLPPNPSVEIVGIESGYKCAVEIEQNGSVVGGTSSAEIYTQKAGFNALSYNSGTDKWTHSGTATIPVQTSSSFTPLNLRVDLRCYADAYGSFPFSQTQSRVEALAIFKFTFTKTGSPTYYVYIKADLDAAADVVF